MAEKGKIRLGWRQRRIVGLVIRGHGNKEIARILGIEYQTVRNRLAEAYKFFGVTGARQLIPILDRVKSEISNE